MILSSTAATRHMEHLNLKRSTKTAVPSPSAHFSTSMNLAKDCIEITCKRKLSLEEVADSINPTIFLFITPEELRTPYYIWPLSVLVCWNHLSGVIRMVWGGVHFLCSPNAGILTRVSRLKNRVALLVTGHCFPFA